jgi:hypothetical protein
MLIVMTCLLNLSIAVSALADNEKDDKSRGCISTRTLKTTAVVNDRNVLFIKVGDTIFHNILPRECKGLSKYKQFSYATTAGSLCSFDVIRVVDAQGRESRSCRLGKFYEISTEELQTLVENSRRLPDSDRQLPEEDDETNKPKM